MPSPPDVPDTGRLYERAACGLLVTDPDGLICKVNGTFSAWLGYPAEALVGKMRIQDLYTIGGRVFHQTHLAPLLQMQGSVAEVQLDMRHAAGHTLPMLLNVLRSRDAGGVIDEVAVFVATDRRKYERELLLARQKAEATLQELRTAQQQLQILADQSDAIVVVDTKGTILQANPAAARMTGYDAAELIGGSLSMFYDAGLGAGVQAAIDGAMAQQREWRSELRIRCKDGSERFSECVIKPLVDGKGVAYGAVSVSRDITERQRDAARLRELNAELALADRKKDEFLATLAHELRNPLAPLRNVLEILRLKSSGDAQLVWAQEVFGRQMEQMSHLVDDLMDVSRITQGRVQLRKQPTDLGAIMGGVVEASAAVVQAGSHKLSLQLPAAPVTLDADPTRLTQILTNLINNAAKYTPDGGYIWFGAEAEGGEVRISVRDSGIGIARDNLANVFTMFSQLEPALERAQGGLGIGLALVKGLVALHGGTITVDSAGVGQGSEFTVRLPTMAAAPAQPESSAVALAPVGAGARVLVVDDNRDAADMLRMALDMLGYEVACAYDAASALAVGAQFKPQVLVLDIGLPDMDGYALARRLRESDWGAHAMLIAATGWGQQSDKDKALEAGFDLHMVKPIDFAMLDSAMRGMLN